MNFRIILLLFISHLLGDFVFQSKYILKLRFEKTLHENIKGNVLHGLIHFSLMIIILLLCKFLNLINSSRSFMEILNISLIIGIIHFFIDEVKTFLINFKPYFKNSIFIFIMDQIVHIISIIFVIYGFKLTFCLSELKNYPNNINYIDRYLISINIFFLCTFASGVFVKQYTNYINLRKYKILLNKNAVILGCSNEVSSGVINGGFIIGILERGFILLVLVIGQPSMAGFVLTAKAIARFKKLDDESFAEYFIIGTFMSFIVAISGGILIYTLKIVPIIK
jgi:hypothetical protein